MRSARSRPEVPANRPGLPLKTQRLEEDLSKTTLLRLAAAELSGTDRDSVDAKLADQAIRLHGAAAPTAAAYCALEAWGEDAKDEYDMWFRVFRRLHN